MTAAGKRQQTVCHLGTAGYVVWAVQWVGLFALYVRSMAETHWGKWLLPRGPMDMPSQPVPSHGGTIAAPLLALSLGLMVAVVVYLLYVSLKTYTHAVAETASKAVHATVEKTVPLVTHVHPASRRRRAALTKRLLFWVKVAGSTVPIGVVLAADGLDQLVPWAVAVWLQAVLGLLALGLFTTQAWLGARWRVSPAKLR